MVDSRTYILIEDVPGSWEIFQDNVLISRGEEPPLSAELEVGLYRIESGPESIELEIFDENSLRWRGLNIITRSERSGKPLLMINTSPPYPRIEIIE